MPKGVAPRRRRICIRRRHEDIDVDGEWEAWERLSYKGLRRKGVPARVSLTIFASAKVPDQRTSSEAAPGVFSRHVTGSRCSRGGMPEAKWARVDLASGSLKEEGPHVPPDRMMIDLAS